MTLMKRILFLIDKLKLTCLQAHILSDSYLYVFFLFSLVSCILFHDLLNASALQSPHLPSFGTDPAFPPGGIPVARSFM